MLITSHVLAGTLIGLATPNAPTAVAVGVVSHIAMDSLPHWGNAEGEDYLRVARVDGVVGLALSAGVLLATPPDHRLRVAAGIFGACLPDTDQIADHFLGRTFHPAWFDRIHAGVQFEHDYLISDVLVIGALASVVTRRLRQIARQRSDPGVVAGRHQGSAGPLQGWSHDQPR